MNKKLILTIGVAGIVALLPFAAFGAQFSGGQSYSLNKGERVTENLYTAGGDVTISGDVDGDLVVAGGTVVVNGTVRQDVLGGGGNISILGKVNGDVRIAGGDVTIAGDVGGELIAFGGTVHIVSGAMIHGGATIAGGRVAIDGDVNTLVRVFGGDLSVNGKVSGDVFLKGDKIKIGNGAVIAGGLHYSSPRQAEIASGARITGPTTYMEPKQDKKDNRSKGGVIAFLTAWWLIKSAMLIAAGLVGLMLFRGRIQNHLEHTIRGFGKEMFRGFVVLVVVPVAVFVSFISVIGAALGGIGLLVYLLMIVIAKVYTGLLVGAVAYKLVLRKTSYVANWQTLVIGVLVLELLALIPILGWLIGLSFFLMAFGSVALAVYGLRTRA